MLCFPKLPGERAFDEMPAPENRISESGVELLVHAPSGDSGLIAKRCRETSNGTADMACGVAVYD